MAHVLIADTPASAVSLKGILKGHELIIANTMEAALAELAKEIFDLIIVGVNFDNSQMFELIRLVHESSNNAEKPIISFSARDTEMTRVIHESINVASKTAGAWMYLDAHSYNVYREPEEELRRIMERCLVEEERKEIQKQRLNIQKQRAELQLLRMMLQEQEWSPELEEYLVGLRHDLEVLLKQVRTLQSSADAQRLKVASSRQLKDRVSVEVTMKEDGMQRTEKIQNLDETRQTIQEQQSVDGEESKRRKHNRQKLGDSDNTEKQCRNRGVYDSKYLTLRQMRMPAEQSAG